MQSILQQLGAHSAAQSLPDDFIARCAAGLAGGVAEKMSLLDALADMAKIVSDSGGQAHVETIQKALFGEPLETLGQELPIEQAQVWQEIVHRVKLMWHAGINRPYLTCSLVQNPAPCHTTSRLSSSAIVELPLDVYQHSDKISATTEYLLSSRRTDNRSSVLSLFFTLASISHTARVW